MADSLTRKDISDIIKEANLTDAEADELLSCCNTLDKINSTNIHTYTRYFTQWKEESYQVTIKKKKIADGVLYAIEPMCGSTTYMIDTSSVLAVIDSGFPCYQNELKKVLCSVVENFENRNPVLILTHMDMDHAGLLSCFSKIYMSKDSYDDFVRRKNGNPNFRESVEKRCPYYRITSVLSKDVIADTGNMIPISTIVPQGDNPLTFIGNLNLTPLSFEVYQTSGGHVEGSIILFERRNRLIFAGDTYVNTAMNTNQSDFIKTSMEMLGSLNADSAKAKAERLALLEMMSEEPWTLCGGHGLFIEYPLEK